MLSGSCCPAPADASAVSSQACQDGGVKATVTGDLVNLRGGPGTAYGVVGRAKNGETLAAVGKNADGKLAAGQRQGQEGLGAQPVRQDPAAVGVRCRW